MSRRTQATKRSSLPYRALAKQYHPDTDLPSASVEMMKLINEAYATLSDGERRRRYDARRLKNRPRKVHRGERRRAADRSLDLAPGLTLPLVRVPAGDFLMGGCTDGFDPAPADRDRVEALCRHPARILHRCLSGDGGAICSLCPGHRAPQHAVDQTLP